MVSHTVENYIKAIFQLSERDGTTISTSALSEKLKTTSASVTDMLKKLAELDLLVYKKYYGVQLTEQGKSLAVQIVRKHRLWETFLHEKLNISWDKVHEIAEQLEHINAPGLIEPLNDFLGNPKFDPHGDPIPDAQGRFTLRNQVLLSNLDTGDKATIVGVRIQEPEFLQYLQGLGLLIHSSLQVIDKIKYDGSIRIVTGDGKESLLSLNTAQNIYLRKNHS